MAAFTACVDKATITDEYKPLQLRQCLAGEALKTINNSAMVYDIAKERLEQKFGGQHHHIALH